MKLQNTDVGTFLTGLAARGCTGTQRLTALAIAGIAGAEAAAIPLWKLAQRTGLTPLTTRLAARALEAKGIVHVTRSPKGRKIAHFYKMNPLTPKNEN